MWSNESSSEPPGGGPTSHSATIVASGCSDMHGFGPRVLRRWIDQTDACSAIYDGLDMNLLHVDLWNIANLPKLMQAYKIDKRNEARGTLVELAHCF